MPSIEEYLKDPLLANWVKSNLAFNITDKVMRPFAVNEIKRLHQTILSALPDGATCTSCIVGKADRCPLGICSHIKSEIKNHHCFPNPSFGNTNIKSWCTDSWEIAKCYMPEGNDYKNSSAEDVDFSTTINVIINCRHFQSFGTCDPKLTKDKYFKGRKFRNEVVHSKSTRVFDNEMETNLDILIDILKEISTPTIKDDVDHAIREINKIKDNKIILTMEDVLREKKQALENQGFTPEMIQALITEMVKKGKHSIDEHVQQGILDIQREKEQVNGTSLIPNFVEGCQVSLRRMTIEHIMNQRPEDINPQDWTVANFLSNVKLHREKFDLSARHRDMLFPTSAGTPVDIRDWDIFLFCFILMEFELPVPIENSVKRYVQEVGELREIFLRDPESVKNSQLMVLSQYVLDADLKKDMTEIFNKTFSSIEVVHSNNILIKWDRDDKRYSNTQETNLPLEILRMDSRSKDLYIRALAEGKTEVRSIRAMVVGHFDVGKTALTKRMLGDDVDIDERDSTEGIEVHVKPCRVSLETGQWEIKPKGLHRDDSSAHLAKVVQQASVSNSKLGFNEKLNLDASANADDMITKDSGNLIASPTSYDEQPVNGTSLIPNFVEGCQVSLRRMTSEHIMNQRPEDIKPEDWTVANFLSNVKLHREKFDLSARHRAMLFPTSGTPVDIRDWDIFLFCFILMEFELPVPIENSVKRYVQEVGKLREIFVRDPESVKNSHLMDLCQYVLDADLKKDMTEIFNKTFSSIEVVHSNNILKAWCQDYERYSNTQDAKLVEPDQEHVSFTGEGSEGPGLSQSRISQNDTTIMKDLNLLKQNSEELRDINNYADLSIWDFAGQYAFYGTHQIFLSRRAVYLLVIDLSKHIDSLVQDDACIVDAEGEKRMKISEFVEFWLKSIHFYTKEKKTVILVGTHLDILEKQGRRDDANLFFDKLRHHLIGKRFSICLSERQFAVNNSIIDSNLEHLKSAIFEVAKSKTAFWGEAIPAKWLPLERELVNRKSSKIIRREELKSLNDQLCLPLDDRGEHLDDKGELVNDRGELDLFLRFQHECGFILYFSEESLKDYIVLDPQWLIDAFKCFITTERFMRNDTELRPLWKEFEEKGILTQEFIDKSWSWEHSKDKQFCEHKDHLLELMERLDIISRPIIFADGKPKNNYYFTPCMLKDPPPRDILDTNHNSNSTSTSKLCYTFDSEFMPPAIFHRLLAACMANWEPREKNDKTLLFCGCGVFDLDKSRTHQVTLYLRENFIHIWVTRFGSQNDKPNRQTCMEVKKQVEGFLRKFCDHMTYASIETYIKCPESDPCSSVGMIKFKRLEEHEKYCCSKHGNDHVIKTSEICSCWTEGKEPSPKVRQEAFLDRIPEGEEIATMSLRIGLKWKQIGYQLGLTVEIEHAEMNNMTAEDRITSMFQEWKKLKGRRATFGDLKTAIIAANGDVLRIFEGFE